MNKEIIHIVVIDDSSNDAETVANMLRNAGQAVRATRVEDDEELRAALAGQSCDMVLTKAEIPHFSAIDAVGVAHRSDALVPVVVLADDVADDKVVEALAAGACDAVYLRQPARLRHAVLREVQNLRQRREFQQCKVRLAEADNRAQALVESSRDAVTYVHDGMHIYANPSYLGMFGYSDFAELEGMPIMNMVAPADHGKFKEFLRSQTKGKATPGELKLSARKADGTTFDLTMEFSSATYEGEPCTQVVIRDQSMSKELEKKLDDLAKQDLLTGVYNRQFFLDSLNQIVGKPDKHGAVLYIRPDDFKGVRAAVGIAASDTVLTGLAGLIDGTLDGANFVARFESHVFTVVLHNTDAEKAQAAAQRVLAAIGSKVFDAAGKSLTLTASIGIALYSDALRPQEVITRAEKAHAQAAGQGLGKVHLYNPSADEMAERERDQQWDARLKIALKENRFRLLFQPIVSLRGDTNQNYELLLRLVGDDGSEITPTEFGPPAERCGLMIYVDRWVLANAVKILTERRGSGQPTNFFAKISGDSLKDPRLLPWLRDLLKAAKLDASTLTIQVSEAVASNNIKALKVLIDGLAQLRVRFGLDHVGLAPNYTNLLRHCDAHFVKIDGSLVMNMKHDSGVRTTIAQITASAKETDKQVIAEFVEDAQTLAAIWSSGIDYIQGHFLQPPSDKMDYDFSAAG